MNYFQTNFRVTRAQLFAFLISIIFSLSQVSHVQAQSEKNSSKTPSDVKKETGIDPEDEEEKAQNPNPPPKESNSSVEKIAVTGSHIRRTDVEGPSPVIVIDREKIEASGMNSVSSVLQQTTASPFGSEAGTVNLKGLGAAKTLILINGQRAPGTGSSYQSGPVSTDFIPIAAVERIEILKDGASATYGSDALGGVVNIITRTDIDGFSLVNQYNMTSISGADSNRASLAYGKQNSISNFMTSAQLTLNQGSRLSARDWSGLAWEVDPRRATNYRDDASALRPGPNCNKLNENNLCADYDRSQYIFEDGYDIDWVTQYTRDVGAVTQFYSTLAAGYSYSPVSSPVVLQTPQQGLGIRLTGAETPSSWDSLPGYSGGDTFLYHRFDDFRNRQTTREYYIGLVTGARGYIGDSDWQWDATLNNQINIETITEENVGVFSGTKAALVSGAYNPFDVTQRDLTGMGTDTFNRNRYMVNWAEAKTNGFLGSWLSFDWSAAFGASVAHFEYSDKRSAIFLNNDAMGQSGVVGSAGREMYSFFAETSGLVGNDFEIQFSIRGDAYSDFGETFNPKLATKYQPFKWLTFRASAGTGFQAPTLQDMNAALEGFFNNFQDLVRCNQLGDCDSKSTTASQATNPNLKQEESLSFNFGTIVQPTENFTFGFDVWRVKVTDVIGTAFSQALRIEDDFGRDKLTQYGINIIRQNNDPTGEIERITYSLANLGTQDARGLDFDINYRLKTSIGDFAFSNELSYMFHYYQEFIDLYGREMILGRQGIPRWRNNITIGYFNGPWSGQVVARSTADMLETGNINTNLQSIPSPTQFDISSGYKHPTAGSFQFGIINIGNSRPRFSSVQPLDTTLFRPITTYYLTYRQDF